MFNFTTNKKEYNILKIFKILDYEDSKEFPANRCIKICLDFLNDNYCRPDIFDLNYGSKEWHNFESFTQAIIKFRDDKITCLSCYYPSSKSRFSFSNDNLNNTNRSLSHINITIAVEKSKINSNEFINLVEKMSLLFGIDYAYVQTITEDYDFDTEKKIKKSFFGNSLSVSIDDDDISHEKRKIEFINGYIQKIYLINFLNESQLKSPIVKLNIENNLAELSKFNKNLYCLILNT